MNGAAENVLLVITSLPDRASAEQLAGALTRRAGIDVLDLQFRLAALNTSALSLLFFDLDHFKSVNDTFGHDVGDRVLRDAAHALAKAVRKCDRAIRWGGEEFVVVLPTADADEADAVSDRIIASGLGGGARPGAHRRYRPVRRRRAAGPVAALAAACRA